MKLDATTLLLYMYVTITKNLGDNGIYQEEVVYFHMLYQYSNFSAAAVDCVHYHLTCFWKKKKKRSSRKT